MKQSEEWLRDQEALARSELHQAAHDLFDRASADAERLVRERPALSLTLAAAAGFATVRIARSAAARCGRGLRANWVRPAVAGLHGLWSAASLLRSG